MNFFAVPFYDEERKKRMKLKLDVMNIPEVVVLTTSCLVISKNGCKEI